MSNVIQIRHGSGIPTGDDLAHAYELGFSTTDKNLYINNVTSIERIGIQVSWGSTDPDSGAGLAGDIYFKMSGDEIIAAYVKIGSNWVALPTGGGGASVYIGTEDPASSLGEDGNLYVKYHLNEDDEPVTDTFYVKISGSWCPISTSGGVTYLELTAEAYASLTPEEKNNGTMYFVTDANIEDTPYIDLSAAQYSVLTNAEKMNGDLYFFNDNKQPVVNAMHNYSTTEHIVGTWIDGSDICERTIYIPNISISGSTTLTVESGFNDFLISATGVYISPDNITLYMIPEGRLRVFVNSSHELKLEAINGGSFNGGKGYLTIQYTKAS